MAKTDEQGQLLSTGFNASAVARRSVDELIGICKGMTADTIIHQKEAEFLQKWLRQHEDIAHTFPACVLISRLENMLCDGYLDDLEKVQLFELMEEVTGGKISNADEYIALTTTLPLDMPPPDITHPCNLFCLSGIFTVGTRKRVEKIISERGGEIADRVTKQTDYLLLGLVGSRDWVHSSFGQKIERAMEIKEKGGSIKIVSEEHWIKFI
jgi:NAD-dependent DNA ligase